MYYTLEDLRADLARDVFGTLEQTGCNGNWEQLDTTPLKSRAPKQPKKHFNVGDTVIVVAQGYNYSNQIGVVANVSGGTARVIFEHGNSSYKFERLDKWDLPVGRELEHILAKYHVHVYEKYMKKHERKENAITNTKEERKEVTNMATNLTGFKRVAIIDFGGYNNRYAYALYDDTVEVGDEVVVTGKAEGQLLTVVEIINATDTDVNITAEVIAKVDKTDYNKRVENRRRKAELARQMDKIIAQNDENSKYAGYAESLGGKFAEMFEEFKTL